MKRARECAGTRPTHSKRSICCVRAKRKRHNDECKDSDDDSEFDAFAEELDSN